MSQTGSELTVRQHHRFPCSLPTQLAVASASADRVKLSRAALGGAAGIATTLKDISTVGAGILSKVYFPVGCKLTIAVAAPDQSTVQLSGSVIRVIMIDRAPTYLIGAVFDAGEQAPAQKLIAAVSPAAPAQPVAPAPAPAQAPAQPPQSGGADARS